MRLPTLKETFRFAAEIAAGYGCLLAAYGGTALLFPSGESFVRERGIDPAALRAVTDGHVRVRSQNFGGKLHTFFGGPFSYFSKESKSAFAEIGMLYYVAGVCPVTMADPGRGLAELIHYSYGIPKHMIGHNPVSYREAEIATVLHEARHCNSGQAGLSPMMREADSDAHGYLHAAKILSRPEMATAYIYMRALAPYSMSHDTSLYVDAVRRGVSPPSEAEMKAAIDELNEKGKWLERLSRSLSAGMWSDPRFIRLQAGGAGDEALSAFARDYVREKREDGTYFIMQVRAMRAVLSQTALSPLARRRGELFIEAAEYFAPAAAGVKPRLAPQMRPSF